MMVHEQFISHYKLEPKVIRPDTSKPGRKLFQVKVGGVYMTRLIIDPGVTTGNYYHKKNRLMFYVESGNIRAHFEQVKTLVRDAITLRPGIDVIHVPTFVATATTNVGKIPAVLIYFSNEPLRDGADLFEHKVF